MSLDPMSSHEEDKVVHEYDGIEEFDNRLPNWWLNTLYGTVVFALIYWFHYQVLHSGPSNMESYEISVAEDRRAAADQARRSGAITDEVLVTLSRDAATVRQGAAIFAQNCVACHLASGGGSIGPNLTDRAWIHGGRAAQIFHTVMEGVPAKGMVAWGPQIGIARVQSVVAYVLTLRNMYVPGGRPPQGDLAPE